jgi:ADP-heptose:LPS heptosyltransferase
VHPGASWPNKRYPAPRWGEVGRRVTTATGLPGVVVGGPGEHELASAAVTASAGALRPVATPDLATLAAVLRRARLVLGSDSGPIHLAHALGATVLCLLGPTDPATHGPYGRPDSSLWRQLPCSFCHRRFDAPKACLTTLPPAVVAERAASLAAL